MGEPCPFQSPLRERPNRQTMGSLTCNFFAMRQIRPSRWRKYYFRSAVALRYIDSLLRNSTYIFALTRLALISIFDWCICIENSNLRVYGFGNNNLLWWALLPAREIFFCMAIILLVSSHLPFRNLLDTANWLRRDLGVRLKTCLTLRNRTVSHRSIAALTNQFDHLFNIHTGIMKLQSSTFLKSPTMLIFALQFTNVACLTVKVGQGIIEGVSER